MTRTLNGHQVNPANDPNSVKIIYPKPAWGK